jgi:predicted RNA-binding Zn ribbon-like protein
MVSNIYDPDGPSRAASLELIGGALALDFANTASGRGGPMRLEHLRRPEHVAMWAEHAGIIDKPTARRIQERLASGDPNFAGILADTLALREAIYGIAAALARQETPSTADIAVVKERCARAILQGDLVPGSDGFRWSWPTDPPIPDTILGPIALSAVGLMREGDPTRVKQCSGEHCGWVFFDLSKNKRRRWCEMSVCGNRAKAKRHASARRTGSSTPTSA